ncbi:peptidyl-prolyl cis-trans isomerase C [Saccharomonospora amisosensis]|uniref:peptidylprolyl isomerase n=1 Tax=Saccharomonospora amisosensis TaxID=1128677 RepID=A0A7X5ZNI9_9PSEU|nr:peptidyl-prolyl cis-trans isomerase [Saccharomonospora amisosensis]NIJ09669.1 peptidyl-prolyl cis-trans isomerase C [Saccharomonospora amisosensis]
MKQRQTSDVTDAKEQDADTRENDAERSGTDRDTHVAEDCSPDQRREQGTQGTGGQDRDIANNDDSGADGVDAERNADGEPGGLRGLLRRIRLPRTRKARTVAAVMLLLLAGGGAGGYLWWAGEQLPDDAAFRIDDRVVTVDDLGEVTDTWRALYGIEPPQEPGRLDRFRRDAAKAYAVSLLLDRAARDHKIVVADKAARDTLSRFVTQQFGEGTQGRDQFVQALGNAGTSERAVLDEVKKQLAMDQLFNTVTKDTPKVGDQEIREAFSKRKDQLGTPERRELANIVVRTKDEADRIVAELRGGASFDTLARQHSLDSATRSDGGNLGTVTRDQLQPDYAKAAFAAGRGEHFGPVQNQFGWNVGMVTGITPAEPARFDQVRDPLKQQLELERKLQTWRDWLAERIRDAEIQYADAYLPASPDAPPSVQPGELGIPQGQEPAKPAQPPRQGGPR